MSGDQLQPEDTLDDRGVDDVLDEGYSPPDRETAHLRHPDGESMSERLADEQPEVWAGLDDETDDEAVDGEVDGEVGDRRTGRLLAPCDGGIDGDEIDQDLTAFDEGIDGAGASAEEAAMHTIDPDQYSEWG